MPIVVAFIINKKKNHVSTAVKVIFVAVVLVQKLLMFAINYASLFWFVIR